MSKTTAYSCLRRLNSFKGFILSENDGLNVDDLVDRNKEGKEDPYDVLSEYSAYLRDANISTPYDKNSCNNCQELYGISLWT